MGGPPPRSIERKAPVCPLCGGRCLPLPRLGAAMLSDGRIVSSPLAKMSCLSCGCTSHLIPPTRDIVRTTFGDDYSLSHTLDGPGLRRGAAFADLILDAVALPMRARVLDVGCGSGALLIGIAERRPDAVLAGVEAAFRPAAAATGDRRIAITRAFAEDLSRPERPFDLVCSINVIEHSFDPETFLGAMALQAAAGGRVAVVCPRADEPSLELLFTDHVHTLTPTILAALGRRCGLGLIEVRRAPDRLGDFQLCVFEKSSPRAGNAPPVAADAIAGARIRYLEAWTSLDDTLSETMSATGSTACFGAAEAAALLRAYAPRVWARTATLMVDEPNAAWNLGRPVQRYEAHFGSSSSGVLLAVHPGRQAFVGERLARDGYRPIPWPDAIDR